MSDSYYMAPSNVIAARERVQRQDLRADLILRVQQDHMAYAVGTDDCSRGEHWRCKCGEKYKGAGAISKGRRHVAVEILAAIDEAAGVA